MCTPRKPKDPVKAAEPARIEDPNVKAAREKERRAQRNARGRSSTLITDGVGEANLSGNQGKVLLGE